MSVEMQSLVNPLCAALSVCLMAAVARQIWPNDKVKPLLAAGLLAASSQFLVMSMTAYAMPAHLALNLLWLWLYLAPQKRRFWLAPLVGVAALGLHQPFFHALFVTPFLARLVWERRWKTSCYFALVYLAGIACWYAWWQHFIPSFSGGSSPQRLRRASLHLDDSGRLSLARHRLAGIASSPSGYSRFRQLAASKARSLGRSVQLSSHFWILYLCPS